MPSLNGTILDATALIDFCWLFEWEWLQKHYSPLYIAQEVLDSDNLEPATREAARKYLTPLSLDTEEMFTSFLEFGNKVPLLSIADPQHKTAIEVMTMADTLIEERGKRIAPKILAYWRKSLQSS
ncbi:MAG: hypothetical protein AB4426_30480 [Xenococcaceae cyanobacterium]